MKKFTKSLLLIAALFSMTACAMPVNSANSSDSGYTGPAKGNDDTFAISYEKDSAVSIRGPQSAAKGSKVTFSLGYNGEEYVVDGIAVNNERPFSEGENSFSFRMPESAVTVKVTGHYVDPNHGKYQIINAKAEKGVVLYGANEYAAEGETVSFSVKFAYDSPYTFTNNVAVVQSSNNEAVEVAVANNVYSFVMPADDVIVGVSLEANKYKLTIGNTEKSNNFASSPFAVIDASEEYASLSAEYFSDYNAYYVAYGETVRAKVKKSSDRLVVQGLHLRGSFDEIIVVNDLEAVSEEDYYYAYFDMPAFDVDVTAFGDVNYKSVTVVNSDHYQATLQSKVGGEYVDIEDATQIIPGDIVYVAISEIDEPDPDYAFEKITLSDGSLLTDTAGSLYHFTMPNKDNVTVTVSEKNMAQYKNCDFVGTHYGNNIYLTGSGKSASMSSTYTFTVEGDGSIKFGTYSYTIESYEEMNNGSFGLVTTTNEKEFAYSGKFIIGNYSNLNYNYEERFNKDYVIAIKGLDGDTLNNYKFYYQSDSDKTFMAVQAYRVVDGEETLYASMIWDRVNGELYSKDATFNFTVGEKVSDANATYSITYGDAIVGQVTNGSTFTNLVPHPQALTIVNSTHYSAAIYDGETELTDTSAINAGTTLTVKLSVVDAGDEAVEGTDFIFDKLSFSAGNPSVTTVTTNREYKFAMPKADVTMTISEKDLSVYKGYPFIGEHFGANLDTAGQVKNKAMGTSYSANVKTDGSVYKGTNSYATSTITSATSSTGDGIATLASGNDFSYSDKFVFSHWNFANNNANAYGKDFIVAVKKSEASDTSSLYTYNYHFGASKLFISVEAYRDGVLYAVMFYDAVNHEFYGTGLEFEFLDDKTTVGESTNYNIKVNDVVIGTVSANAYAKA